MTQWRPAVTENGEPPATRAGRASARRLSRQSVVLIAALGLLLAAGVVALVAVAGSGSDGPAPGSPDAVTDSFAAALHAGDAAALRTLSCPGSRGAVLAGARHVLGRAASVSRQGSAGITGATAVERLALALGAGGTAAGRSAQPGSSAVTTGVVGTVALTQTGAGWCVAAFGASVPVS